MRYPADTWTHNIYKQNVTRVAPTSGTLALGSKNFCIDTEDNTFQKFTQ